MTRMKVILTLIFAGFLAIAHSADPFYDTCGTTKTCLGFPEDCLPDKDCVTLSSTFKKDGKYFFEMRSYKGAAYIAMALSSDKKMGDDSVIECVKEGDEVKLYSSWTDIGKGEYKAVRDEIPQQIIRLVSSKIEDNRIFCTVERDAVTTIRNVEFDLNKKSYYLLLASGTLLKENSVGYHDYAYTPSDEKVKFNK